MANIYPFKGVRYDKSKVGRLDDVVTPPYDVISPDEQQWYLGKHPNSIIRLILPREGAAGDTATKYEKAAAYLGDWMDSGVLARDPEPSFYACEQEYEIDGVRKKRLGFTCLVRIEDYDKKTVLPHENILAKPMDDRLNLLRATRTNFDSVFGLYSSGKVDEILRPYLMKEADATAVDRAGVYCNLWKISDPAAIQEIMKTLADESILIADGHHRYAAALAYRNEVREKNGIDSEAPCEFVMMTLVSLEDPGLVVLPTHRLVRNLEGFEPSAFLEKLSEFFDVAEVSDTQLESAVSARSAELHVFGLYMNDGRSYVISLRPGVKPEQVIESPGSDALKRLDVSVLHSIILDKMLGIGVQQMSAQSNLSYMRDAGESLRAVDRGEYQLAFLMNPTRVDEVKAVAAAGDKMPQKSTFFYPKLLTGLILRVME
ncbi:MAG TPA: DUF1015 domain-containing protein [Armatimonadota bacterium]